MMSVTLRRVFTGADLLHGSGISAFAVGTFAGVPTLFAVSSVDGGVTSFRLAVGANAVLGDQVAASGASGSYGAADVDLVDFGGETLLLVAGRYDDHLAFRHLGGNGSILGLSDTGLSGGAPDPWTEVEGAWSGGNGYIIAGSDTSSGLDVYRLMSGPGLVAASTLADTGTRMLGNISDLLTAQIGGRTAVFTVSALDNGITSLTLDGQGRLTVEDQIGSNLGIGFDKPNALAVVDSDGASFLVVGASGSGSLTVFSVAADGELTLTDMIWDDLSTRYAGVTALETFEANGRGFVLAGGSDGGLTMFELGADGQLYRLATLVDTAVTTLASISAIEAVVIRDEVQLFVSSASETGITQFNISLASLGDVFRAGGAISGAVGIEFDDFLLGSDGRDLLRGMAGDDRLVDGGDVDALWGGAGADSFVFVRDGRDDQIMDFQLGLDRIDLSQFGGIYSLASLRIDSMNSGFCIDVGNETILVHTYDGRSLDASDITAGSFIF